MARSPSARAITIGGLRSIRKRPHGQPVLPARGLLLASAPLQDKAVSSYAKLCGFTERQGVPLTFPHILAFPLHMQLMLKPDFPFPLIGLLHLSNRIEQVARLSVGQTLSITACFGGFVLHDRGQAFTIETIAEHEAEPVWRSISTYLRLGVRNSQGAPAPSQPAGPQPLSIKGPWRLQPALGKRYAEVSGDRNPIHTSRIGARLLGFRRPIAHGMWAKARAVAALLPDAPIGTASVDVAFKTPVFLPSSVILLHTRTGKDTFFEMRDRSAEKPHLRGILHAEPA